MFRGVDSSSSVAVGLASSMSAGMGVHVNDPR